MKFWAEVRFKEKENAEHLIHAFFQNFNRESSIVVRGKVAKMEIVFNDKPPMEIIEAIKFCEDSELIFGKNLTEYKEDENEQVETEVSEKVSVESNNSKQTEQTGVESDNFEQIEQTGAESENFKQSNGRIGRTPTNKDCVNIPELEQIAKKATSFEHFVKLVAEWLEMDKRQEFFEKLAVATTEVNKISWKELENVLKSQGVVYKDWDRMWSARQIAGKLKDYSITILPFLCLIGKYKEYPFKQEVETNLEVKQTTTTEVAEEQVVQDLEAQETTAIKEEIPKVIIKMECMPEIKTFEETLGSVDKTQPIEERVRYVLNAMGLYKKSVKEQKQIFEIANTAVRKEEMDLDNIFVDAKIPMEEKKIAQMTFSTFINDFVKPYESGKKVKLLDFLSQLQKIIMLESEIEKFSDFTN